MPKFSIITPTHNPKHLIELHESLMQQTIDDWEWIVIPNNGADLHEFLEHVNKREQEDESDHVRLVFPQIETSKIGALKRIGFMAADGDILVEVDHDDMLTPDCLEELGKAFDKSSIGFAYSNEAMYGPRWQPYSSDYGWEYAPQYQKVDGGSYHVPIAFEPSAASMAFVWYAPDHVRAWRATTYREIGGHNSTMDILDDHELLIRTYLHTEMQHIDKCLYIYRITGENTSVELERNQRIQHETVPLYFQYAYQLAEREASLRKLAKIDLCGAFNKPSGYLSIDLDKQADIVGDLNDRWPLPDNSVGVIRAHDAIEHLKDKQHVMREMYRVLADGGWAMISVPSTDGRGAFQDPTHVSYWNQNSFWYYTRQQQSQYIHNEKIKFQEFRLDTGYPSPWHEQNKICYTTAHLRAIKSDVRRPHLKWI